MDNVTGYGGRRAGRGSKGCGDGGAETPPYKGGPSATGDQLVSLRS